MSYTEHLISYNKSDVKDYIAKRKGELKIGEQLLFYNKGKEPMAETLHKSFAEYVILGVPEDIGPRANHGNSGASNGWDAFLHAFLNMQSNPFMSGEDVLLLGEVRTGDLMAEITTETSISQLRKLVEQLDERVYEVAYEVFRSGKKLIVIGGGHNNAYPLMKAASAHLKESFYEKFPGINVVNLDPHADFRALEGRHSGNSFSYAFEEECLNRYALVGIHEQYNSAHILEQFETHDERIHFTTFEEIIYGKTTFEEAVEVGTNFLANEHNGIELDMDSISSMPVSAYTPSGIQLEQARYYVHKASQVDHNMYLHLCEAAPKDDKDKKHVGKALAMLVADYVKSA